MMKYKCGCVKDQYWCGKHDIYTKQNPRDLPPHNAGDRIAPFDMDDYKQISCSCHILAPCSFCFDDNDDNE